MFPIRPRVASFAIAVFLLSLAGLAAPVAAADSPEAAVNELIDIVDSGDLDGIESVVCEAERDGARELFDVAGQLGIGSDDIQPGALNIEITDRSVELTGQDGDAATAQVKAIFSLSVAETQVEAIVRSMLEADRGPDDPPVSDEELQLALPFVSSALNQSQPMDEEVVLVRENGQWVVCGGFGLFDEPEPAFEAQISNDGLCGLATPAEVSGVSALEFDSSSGFETVCTYSNSSYDDYHSATLSLNQGYDLDTLKEFYSPELELEVDGYPAFIADLQFFAQVGNDVLQINLYPGESPTADFDVAAEGTALSQLFIPRLPVLAGPMTEPTPQPAAETSLCDLLSLDELNQMSSIEFGDASGDPTSCAFSSLDPEQGFNFINTYTLESSLDDLRQYLPDISDVTIGGQAAITSAEQLFVQLPDGMTLLNVSVYLDPSIDETSMTASELAAFIGERFLAGMR